MQHESEATEACGSKVVAEGDYGRIPQTRPIRQLLEISEKQIGAPDTN
jgi:hypothetical protein